MQALDDFLHSHTQEDLLPWSVQEEAANRFGLIYGEIEDAALEMDRQPCNSREKISWVKYIPDVQERVE